MLAFAIISSTALADSYVYIRFHALLTWNTRRGVRRHIVFIDEIKLTKRICSRGIGILPAADKDEARAVSVASKGLI